MDYGLGPLDASWIVDCVEEDLVHLLQSHTLHSDTDLMLLEDDSYEYLRS